MITDRERKVSYIRGQLMKAMASNERHKVLRGVRVKPLEWEQTGNGWRVGQFGEPVFYQLAELADGGVMVSAGIPSLPRYDNMADAMAAAERHHTAQVRSLLEAA